MDNGEVIPGLNEDWTLGGAKIYEWMAGFMMLIICQEVVFSEKIAKSMPMLMGIWVGTTFGLAMLRRLYPDEERGLRNHAMTAVGIPPPGIPSPALLQPIWSGAPLREVDERSRLVTLGLDQLFRQTPKQESE